MDLIVFRYGHRPERDKRVTTHCSLVSRAFGAKKIYYEGLRDLKLENTINNVTERFGGPFEIEYVSNYMKKLKELKKDYLLVHLTMYGIPIDDFSKNIEQYIDEKKGIVLIVGSHKVPREIYDIADYNISVTNQPHSEIAALAIALDRLNPSAMNVKFSNAKLKIIPSNNEKIVKDTNNL